MNTSVPEPVPTSKATDTLAKEKGSYNSSETPSPPSSPKPGAAGFLEHRIPETPRRAETGSPTSLSTSTALTSIPPRLISESPNVSPNSRPRSRPTSRDTSPYPRSGHSTPNRSTTPSTSAATRVLPPRRSARTLAKGPERPSGPPELEAALTIAIRNLESDIYEWWCANQKPGSPIPTTSYLKSRSPRIRRAAEAVDEADRLLNEAVYGKTRKGRPPGRKAQGTSSSDSPTPSGEVPETAFGQMGLSSQTNTPLRSTDAETVSTQPGGSARQQGPPARNKDLGD